MLGVLSKLETFEQVMGLKKLRNISNLNDPLTHNPDTLRTPRARVFTDMVPTDI
jgi:hypothetical protein